LTAVLFILSTGKLFVVTPREVRLTAAFVFAGMTTAAPRLVNVKLAGAGPNAGHDVFPVSIVRLIPPAGIVIADAFGFVTNKFSDWLRPG
jgi:hypothetical protein